jgi:hypothetical protein
MEAGPYIQTVSGRRFNPLDPEPTEIDIGDIARALSNQCRFGGDTSSLYSVAQPCLVSDLVAEWGGDDTAVLWVLLHDRGLPRRFTHPLKHRSELGRLYAAAEDRLQLAICERFDLPPEPSPLVKQVDRALLATERRDLASIEWHWPELDGFDPLDFRVEPPERAREEFIARYERLRGWRTVRR